MQNNNCQSTCLGLKRGSRGSPDTTKSWPKETEGEEERIDRRLCETSLSLLKVSSSGDCCSPLGGWCFYMPTAMHASLGSGSSFFVNAGASLVH